MFNSILKIIQSLSLDKTLSEFIRRSESFLPQILPYQTKNIALSSVVAWHRWEDHEFRFFDCPYGKTAGWVYEYNRYQHRQLTLEEFNLFVDKEVIKYWQCEIQEVEGLAASKSILENFSSLDEMVETNSKELIYPISHEQLQKNLKWFETRIFHENPSDYFVTHAWDKRIFLVNDGGSHHFAAARYLAKRLNEKIYLESKLYRYTINCAAAYSLMYKFEMFVVSNDPIFTNGFREIMREFKVDYFMRYLPTPYREDHCVLLLPRVNQRSMRVAKILQSNNVIDFGSLLSRFVRIQ